MTTCKQSPRLIYLAGIRIPAHFSDAKISKRTLTKPPNIFCNRLTSALKLKYSCPSGILSCDSQPTIYSSPPPKADQISGSAYRTLSQHTAILASVLPFKLSMQLNLRIFVEIQTNSPVKWRGIDYWQSVE